MYLINSPVVRAEPLKFEQAGVKGVVRDVMIPWYNAFRFMVQNAARWQEAAAATATGEEEVVAKRVFRPSATQASTSTNPLDVWILAEVQQLIVFVHTEMQAYRLYTVMPRLVSFLDQLTKWYVRLNRERLKGSEGDDEAEVGLSVLFGVLEKVTSMMSPFTPFFAEFLYQKLRVFSPTYKTGNAAHAEEFGAADSVHFLQLPTPEPNLSSEATEAATLVTLEMAALQTVREWMEDEEWASG
jgi:isoleucyl-tRNA synthetase